MNRNITATILIVLAIGIYFTVTKSLLSDADAIKAVNTQYSSAIASAEQLITVRDKVLKDFNNVSQEDRDRLSKMLPNTVDNIRLVIDLNSVALQHGFSLRNIKAVASSGAQKPSSPVPTIAAGGGGINKSNIIPTPVLDTVTVSFSVSAPYLQFISLLQDLEANLRIMDVTHLSLTANDSGTYDWSVELKTYWLRSQ